MIVCFCLCAGYCGSSRLWGCYEVPIPGKVSMFFLPKNTHKFHVFRALTPFFRWMKMAKSLMPSLKHLVVVLQSRVALLPQSGWKERVWMSAWPSRTQTLPSTLNSLPWSSTAGLILLDDIISSVMVVFLCEYLWFYPDYIACLRKMRSKLLWTTGRRRVSKEFLFIVMPIKHLHYDIAPKITS